jgi:hypothetical protein
MAVHFPLTQTVLCDIIGCISRRHEMSEVQPILVSDLTLFDAFMERGSQCIIPGGTFLF